MAAPLIAVIDNESAFVEMVSDILADEGYRTTSSLAAADALSVIQQDRPDLIILDVRIEHPEAGWELLQSLRQDPATAHIPIIICSGDGSFLQAKAEQLIRYGVKVLEKPFQINDLTEKVAVSVGPPDKAT